MLTQRGIEANPEKCNAIIEMRSPTNVKEVQCLIGCLTAISRFLPKLAEQTQPSFNSLKNPPSSRGLMIVNKFSKS